MSTITSLTTFAQNQNQFEEKWIYNEWSLPSNTEGDSVLIFRPNTIKYPKKGSEKIMLFEQNIDNLLFKQDFYDFTICATPAGTVFLGSEKWRYLSDSKRIKYSIYNENSVLIHSVIYDIKEVNRKILRLALVSEYYN